MSSEAKPCPNRNGWNAARNYGIGIRPEQLAEVGDGPSHFAKDEVLVDSTVGNRKEFERDVAEGTYAGVVGAHLVRAHSECHKAHGHVDTVDRLGGVLVLGAHSIPDPQATARDLVTVAVEKGRLERGPAR